MQPYDLSKRRAMYDLDLFDLAPAGSALRYQDGTTIEELHARTPRPVVICYVDTGAYEHYRPDARLFPGYHERLADIPNVRTGLNRVP